MLILKIHVQEWRCGDIDVGNDVNRSRGVAVDLCSDVNIENDVNTNEGVLVDEYSGFKH